MIEWVLILTFKYGEVFGIEHIGGFSDAKQCQTAAKAWKDSMQANWDYSRYGHAACVFRGGAKPLPTRVE